VNTFRSLLPGRYGHGAGLVTKKRGKRIGAVTFGDVLLAAGTITCCAYQCQSGSFVKTLFTMKSHHPSPNGPVLPPSGVIEAPVQASSASSTT
jgi:hypothetical protein